MKLLRTRVAAALPATLEPLQIVEHLSQDPAGEDPVIESRIDALVRHREPRGGAGG